ncbi:MAG TPA: hypothetical protein VFI06_12210 [Chitinophagaceae bacterium]|nr:hypothetical protein [Chitinophagaceae bacterium]
MDDLSHIKLSDLLDMLAEYTDRYMKMLSDGASREEFDSCRETIIDIQTEIQARQGHSENSTAGSENVPSN